MPLNSEIANLMVQAGRDRAAGIAGSAEAWSRAVSQIGQQVGQLPGQMEQLKQTADAQRARDARAALSDALKPTNVPTVQQDGLHLYDVNGIGQFMSQKGFGAEFVPAAQHLDAINQSMIGFQQARLSVVQSGAKALLATAGKDGVPTGLMNDFLDRLEKNQVYAPETIQTYRTQFSEHPESATAILRSITGPPKLTSGAPGSVMRDESGQIVPGSQVPNKPEVINGQLVQPDTATPIGAPIPPQVNPTAVATQQETARHNATMEAIAKMTAGREAAAQRETARHNAAMEQANNPLAAITAAAGQPQAAAGAEPPKVTGEDLLKTLPEGVQTTVKALAEGRLAFPAGFALKTPYWQSMLQLVGQYDPSFDAVNYNARSSTRKAFTSGREAGQVNALNTVLGHLDKLSDAAEALGNSDVQAFNSIKNWASKQFGSSSVTNFDTVKKAVADEITRVWRQAGGSVEDVRAAQENLKSSNSPDQLRGAIATYGDLLHSKLESLQDQYKQGMGIDAISLLRPESQKVLDKISARAVGADVPKSGGSAKVGDIKYLPDGTKVQITFIDPKGNATVKKVQ